MPRVRTDISAFNISLFNKWVWGNTKTQGIRQSDIADYLGLPRQAVSQRLSGKTEWKLKELFELQELFGEKFESKL